MAAALVAAAVVGCQKEFGAAECDAVQFEQYLPSVLDREVSVGDNFVLPEGTCIVQYDSSSCEFQLPSGYFFVYRNYDGQVVKSDREEYQCTCSDGGGCRPFQIGGYVGCEHGLCKGSCKGEFVSAPSTRGEGVVRILDMNAPVHFVCSDAEYMPSLPLEFLELPEVVSLIEKFVNDNELPSESDYFAPVEVFGYAIMLPVSPEMSKQRADAIKKPADPCKCASGDGTCKRQAIGFGGYACQADASCTSCSMKIKDKIV